MDLVVTHLISVQLERLQALFVEHGRGNGAATICANLVGFEIQNLDRVQ